MTTPDWLTEHGADLRPDVGVGTWLVIIGGEPFYRLTVAPAKNEFTCDVVQSNNSQRRDRGGTAATPEAALQRGLDDLRAALGW